VLDTDLRRFLEAGPAPIGFTPGSAMAHGRDFFDRALAASRRLGRRALLITPYADQLPDPLPSFAQAVDYAPFDLLLPRLAALVHHGGIGTTAQALAAGKPQGVLPFAHDQLDNAARIERLGVGLQLGRRRRRSVDWVSDLDRLLNDAHIAGTCQQYAALMAAEPDAPGRIAQAIEALAAGSAQVVDAAASQAIFIRPSLRVPSSTSAQSPGSV
jgi:rhamnosyltransferase subunit B